MKSELPQQIFQKFSNFICH